MPAYSQQLARSLSVRENILITLSAVTPASSVFIISPTVLGAAGGAAVAVFLIAAVAACFVSLCYAELSATYPIAGGEYSWAARLLGKSAGFATFLLTMITGVLIIAVIALGTGAYLGVVWSGLSGKWIGAAVIVVTAGIAMLNIRANAWITGIALSIEILAVTVLAVLGFAHSERGPSAFVHAQTIDSGQLSTVSIGALAALVPVALFAYNGYGQAVYYVEETKNAVKSIGKIILICLGVTVAVEVIPVAAVVLGAPNMQDLLGADAPINYLLTTRGGTIVNEIVSLGIAIAIINGVIAIVLQISRLLFSSARDRSWPGPIDDVLGSVHPTLRTPVAATLVVGVVAALAAAFVPMKVLITATGAAVVLVYLTVAIAALRLRRGGAVSRGYRMPLWPLPPLIVIAMMLYVVYRTLSDNWEQVAFAVSIMVVGALYYRIYLHPRRGDRWTLPDPVHES
ncbi:APC family permease [Nocardia panacis]|uniref:APC family permease n=2 Tax=Nocardia panacis TaxID=2340916 RepID=A0A3A4K8F8_9NOCA|nr:APC family permease [Nocardia panacis]